ncbi:hypothetical protein T4E_7720 [Trichinella pseudospiralis]|uniref:Uncharacterized protein n=1 Tax=Trichinella pseudospiralis TaxID=6337 RepID=A0A0V0XEQ1_TRIPS|nr:hypothetical protein T4E_7361 [Trichinella pseudospiralis]KRX95297.1 hypothetical protein T4E_7720 [Trichinella pseudospiralis]
MRYWINDRFDHLDVSHSTPDELIPLFICFFFTIKISISRVISDLKTSAGRYCGDPSTTSFACKLLTVSSSYLHKFVSGDSSQKIHLR